MIDFDGFGVVGVVFGGCCYDMGDWVDYIKVIV